ncbi:MAG: hypothetical protein ACJKSS_01050 [Patescibacteria group bacterium UBA2103]
MKNDKRIKKNIGVTASERYLQKLAEESFLELWSWPNLYKKKNKELCDLLVICGEHIIIFSDKTISYPNTGNSNLDWSRWYKRAVFQSAKQAKGAARWIKENPERVFLDKDCRKNIPFDLSHKNFKIHIVCVALGAEEKCKAHFGGGSGSLVLVAGKEPNEEELFFVGDVFEDDFFVHVLNEANLDIVLRELNTITDFTDYLVEKENFLRSGRVIVAEGEEELLAWYLQGMKSRYKHGFIFPEKEGSKDYNTVIFGSGLYDELKSSKEYALKKEADEISILWDSLIDTFTKHMLEGTTMVRPGEVFSIDKHKAGVETMALEPRIIRRLKSEGLWGMLQKSHEKDRTFRAVIPNAGEEGVGYVFMTLKVPQSKKISYAKYRRTRHMMLLAYVLGTLKMYPHIKKIVGIAFEPPSESSSEDMIYAEQPIWTKKLVRDLEKDCAEFNLLQDKNLTFGTHSVSEYPHPNNS